MKLTKLTWVSILLNLITAILATAIIVLILIGATEPANGEEKEVDVVCDCTCSVEKPVAPTAPIEPTETTVTTEPVETTEPSATTESTVITEPTEVADNTYLGEFKLTAYCPCAACNGKWAGGITSTGVMAKAGRTIAVDPTVIPYGTEVIINGHTYVAEDCGGSIKGNRIDVYFDSHSDALDFGVQYADIYIVGS